MPRRHSSSILSSNNNKKKAYKKNPKSTDLLKRNGIPTKKTISMSNRTNKIKRKIKRTEKGNRELSFTLKPHSYILVNFSE